VAGPGDNPAVSGSRYVFERAGRDVERERLAVLEALFDPATRRVLEESGLRRGWRCLDGAGGGSIARFLADRGASVLAVDLDARLLREHSHPAVEVLEGDLAAYGRFVQDPGSWAVRYATVRARATRPAKG